MGRIDYSFVTFQPFLNPERKIYISNICWPLYLVNIKRSSKLTRSLGYIDGPRVSWVTPNF